MKEEQIKGFIAIPPGEHIADEMEARGQSIKDLATLSGLSETLISQLIAAEAAITPAIAKALETAWGPKAQFWLNLEARYRQRIAELHAQENQERLAKVA